MPASYSLRIKPSAEKELHGLPKADLRRIVRRIQGLTANPRPPGCEKLFGENGHRLRQGDYHVLYVVDDEVRTVEIYKIGHRREVYR